MKNGKLCGLAVIIVALALVAGCANQQVMTPDKMSAKDKGTFVLTLYNNAFTNYNAQFAATPKPMAKDMVNYFQGYKNAMEATWPVISAYTAIVNVGGTPTPEQEQQIIQIIYQLQAILIAKLS